MKSLILKIISCVAFCAVGFPIMFGVDVNRFGNISAARMVFYAAVCGAFFALGALCTGFVKGVGTKPKRERILRGISRGVGVLSFFGGFISLAIKGDAATVIALGFCCVLGYFIGERAMYKNFSDMFPLSAFGFYLVFSVGWYFFIRLALPEGLRETASDVMTVSFCAEIMCAALLVNQSGIFTKANMRKETRSSLPKGLSAYNAALILAVSVIGLGLTAFRGQIAWLISQLFLVILRGAVAFMSLFSAEKIPIEEGSGEAEIGGELEAEPNYLWEAVGVIILLALVIKFRRQIFAVIKGFFERLGQLLSGKPEESFYSDFTDRFEDLGKSKNRRSKPFSYYTMQALYKTETDPTKKYRLGYGVLLHRIKQYNHTLTVSDTVSEQAKKGGKYFGLDKLESIGGSYESVRYGENVPAPAELSELDDILKS